MMCSVHLLTVVRVNDEKDARGYLQALAAKMTDELDSLRMSGTPASVSKFATFYFSCDISIVTVTHNPQC